MLVRSVSGNGTFQPSIRITATPQGNLSCYTVTESVAPGLTPGGLGTNALWNPFAGTINWGPFLDHQPRVLNYSIGGSSGTYPLVGGGSFDGYDASASGAATVTINQFYFGTSPPNNLGCSGEPLDYAVAVNPAPGVIMVTAASGTLYWGDGTQSVLTQPAMILPKQYTSAGTYTVAIAANWTGEDSLGQFYSGYATQTNTVQVLTNCYPVITSGPSNVVALAGATVQFNVTVLSPYPVFYQWYFNTNFPIVGPFSSTLPLPDVTAQEGGAYSVIATNVYGSATSHVATLTVSSNLVAGITRNSNGSITMSFEGLPNSASRLWLATNLVAPAFWRPIFTNNNLGPSGIWQVTDTNTPGYPARFYRFSTP